MSAIHETKPVLVWADIDLGIVEMVERLNHIPGCRTDASCQGTMGEGGPHPYPAHVLCHWALEALPIIRQEFEVIPEGDGSWGNVYRKGERPEVSPDGDAPSLECWPEIERELRQPWQ